VPTVTCPECGTSNSLSGFRPGEAAVCRACDATIYAPGPRRRRAEDDDAPEFRCPFCKARTRPEVRSRVATGGWVLLMVLLVVTLAMSAFGILCLPFCFSIFLTPLCLLGLLVRENYRTCSACGINLG
jgi:hypothetical protein